LFHVIELFFFLLFSATIADKSRVNMVEETRTNSAWHGTPSRKEIILNAFDMSTVGHLSPGQWKVNYSWKSVSFFELTCSKDPEDRSDTKRSLDYWINLAKLLERGDINALFLADTYGGYDTYEDSLDNCIRRAAQWPMTDPSIVN
jgi:hypothetical protein